MSIEPISRSGPLTRWLRAGPWEIPFSEEIQMMGLRPPGLALFVRLSGLEEWSWYDPMVDARDAYLVCASIRDDLWVEPNDHAERDVRKRILDFFNRYGPLLYGPQLFRGEMGPLEVGPDGVPLSDIAVPLWEVIKHTTLFAVALRCYQALEVNWDKYHAGFEAAMDRTEVQDLHLTPNPSRLWGAPPLDGSLDFSQPESLRVLLWALVNHWGELNGVSPGLNYTVLHGWQHAFHYDSLVSAMWLQLHQAILGRVPVRECEGCGVMFEASRTNQVYHDDLCRGRAAARRSYHAKKGGEEK